MTKRFEKIWRSVALASLVVFTGSPAFAELYKYQKPNGEILITSEKRPDLKLVEVIEGPSPGSRRASKSPQISRAPAVKAEPKAGVRLPSSQAEREKQFDDIIREASEAYDVPFGFIKAVIRIESNFNPNAVSHAGAMGLMQLMPRTAASLSVTDPFDPRQNIFGGAKFLRILIDRYDGDINLILAAYNAGDAAVARYDGIPYPQTRGYVAKVYRWYRNYSSSESND